VDHRVGVADGLRAVGAGFRGSMLPHFTHPADHDS
jgi:hypothetical protein